LREGIVHAGRSLCPGRRLLQAETRLIRVGVCGAQTLGNRLVNDCGSVWWRCAGKLRCTARITANHRLATTKSARPKEGREVTPASAAH
jgi:hypothetical protein